ncbi:MAG TPA: nucleotide sugar dehydrogenase [Candidatus Saccharimonadales bacterium]|nr:nucleotide sugar dehydrogenase [Candidatus Saccharimonadales bacterium]
MKKVAVVGLWHLGLVNSVGFCKKGYHVTAIDFDKQLISKLKKSTTPIHEPGLDQLIGEYLKKGQLDFSSNIEEVAQADYIVIAYDSPVNEKDEVDIAPIVKASEAIAPLITPKTPLIITSQVPLGSCEKIEATVKKINPSWASGVVYTPENLRLGSAIELFTQPDMIVLGSNHKNSLEAAHDLYAPFKTNKFSMNLRSAEMVKHAINTFLATSITFGNEIANISDRLGADAVAVGMAIKADRRIGKAPVLPGLGFSGGTLARDVEQLKKFSREINYPGKLLQSITAINEDSFNQIILKLRNQLGRLEGKTIGILGLTYKPGTSTLRRSPALKIIDKLLSAKAICLSYDPLASDKELQEIKLKVKRMSSVSDLAKKSDALVLVTEWPEFKELDFKNLSKLMESPLMIDTKNFLDPENLVNAGFNYVGYGRSLEAKESL